MSDVPSRNGDVWLRHFNQGVIESLGGVEKNRIVNGKPQKNWCLPPTRFLQQMQIKGTLEGNAVLITFVAPEETYDPVEIPEIVVRQKEPIAAPVRWLPYSKQYRIGVPGTEVYASDGTTLRGYRKYESKEAAFPYDIGYDISCYARLRRDAEALLQHVTRRFKAPGHSVSLRDSLGAARTYDSYQEGLPIIEELAKVGERVIGYTVSIRVLGEIDQNDPETETAVTSLDVDTQLR